MDMDFEQRVRERAYHIWESRGRTPGADLAHWCEAEQELRATASAMPADSGKKAKSAKKSGRTKKAA
jgi:hypothetical protein